MIDVVRIDHLSMAVPELEPQIDLLERLFGFRYTGRFTEHGYVGADLEVPGSSGITWEVLAPDGPDSYLNGFIEGASGPGLHHLALQVRDMNAAVATMRSLGVEPWGYHRRGEAPEEEPIAERGGEGDQTEAVAYLHPRAGGAGFLYQLYEGEPWHLPETFADERSNTLGITAINAIGHAHQSRQELGDWYERLFGFETVHLPPASLASTSFVSRILEVPSGQLRVEVMQPAREDSVLQRFLDRRGPGVHHVSFEVGDMSRALAACDHHRVPVFGDRSGRSEGARWREAFIAPEHTGGMLVQFFSWDPIEWRTSAD
jgi:methylmalonyl-CoA/ethylmalonyl-CoA epimerase